MNDLQKTQLAILKEFDRICTANNIPYSLARGSALGAVRHKGFIPWDDDLDVVMMRDSFRRLEAVWEAESDPNFFLQTYKSDPDYFKEFAKIRDGRTTYIETVVKDLDIHHGVFIDVFICDNVPANKVLSNIQYFFAKMFLILSRPVKFKIGKRNCTSRLVFKLLPVYFRIACKSILNYFIEKIGLFNSAGVSFLIFQRSRRPVLLPKDLLLKLKKVPFEGELFPIMEDYDIYLRTHYGDYMTVPPASSQFPWHKTYAVDAHKPYKNFSG